MPYIRNKRTGETVFVPDQQAGPQGIPIGPQDPAEQYRGPAAATGIASQQSNMRNDAIRTGLAQQDAGRDAVRTGIAVRGEDRGNRNDTFDHINKLAERYGSDQTVKEYRIAVTELARALQTGDGPQADLALTYAFAKAMDPGSVVRDTEQAMQTNSQPWFQSKVEQIKKQFGMDGAGTFTPEARAQLRQQVINGVSQRSKLYDSRRDYYSEVAKRNGFDPYEVVGEHDAKPFLPDLERYDQKRKQDQSPLTAGVNRLADGGDTRKSIPIPPDMQAEYARFVGSDKQLDPQAYAQFRVGLDQKYEFGGGGAEQYAKEANELNKARAAGRNFVPQIPAVDAAMTGRDQLNASVFNSRPGAFAMGAGSLGGAADEVFGGLKSLATGRDMGGEIAKADAMRQAAAAAFPGYTMAGNLTGAVATGAVLPTAPGLLGAMGSGAAYGAASGALENNGNRLAGAAMGAGVGAAGGAVGAKLVGPLGERIGRTSPFQQASRAISNRTGRDFTPAPQLSPLETAAMAVNPNMAQISGNLRDAGRLNLPYSLADAAPELRTLGGTVSRKSPQARALAETTFEPRGRGQADRFINTVDAKLAPYTNIEERGRDLLEAGNMASRPYYDMAGQIKNPTRPGMEMFYSQPANPDTELSSILRTPTGKDALSRASRILGDRRGSPRTVGLATDASGNTILQDGHSFEALDLVKKGMDDIIQGHADPITGKVTSSGKPQLQAIEGLRRQFVDRLDAINPTYKQARETYQPYAQRKEALDAGYEALPRNDVPERVFNERLSGLPEGTINEARRGYATAMSDKASAMRHTANPYEALYGSPLQQRKVGQMFPDGAADFDRTYNLERDMAKTHYETLGGSPTAARQAADEALGGHLGTMAVDAVSQAATGGGLGVGTAIQAARRILADAGKLGIGKAATKRAEEMAPQLFDTSNPAAIADLVDQMGERLGAISERKARYARRSGLIGSSVASSLTPRW